MSEDVLDEQTPVLVTMEEPPRFARLCRAWEEGGHTGLLTAEEHCYQGSPERTAAQRAEFARYVRDIGYQSDLERTGQRPVVSVTLTPPQGIPAVGRHHSGAIHVTRRAREVIENTTAPMEIIPAEPPLPAELVERHADPAGD